MLSWLTAPLIKQIADSFLGKALDAFKAYENKQISIEELKTQVAQALLSTFTDIEKTYAQELSKQFATFWEAASKSKLMQSVWAAAALSQLFVLFWYQWVVPALVTGGWITKWASPGTTVEWAYWLIMFLFGGGAIVLKSGPGASSLKDQLKSLIGR